MKTGAEDGPALMMGVVRPEIDLEDAQRLMMWGRPARQARRGGGGGRRIGMLLDLDQGNMTVYKNEDRLGVLVAEGLCGPFSWAAVVMARGSSARIESALLPDFAKVLK